VFHGAFLQAAEAVIRRFRQQRHAQPLAHQRQNRGHVVGFQPRHQRQALFVEQLLDPFAHAAVASGEDHRLAAQVRQTDGCLARQQVFVGQEQAQAIDHDHFEVQVMIEPGPYAQSEVHFVLPYQAVDTLGDHVPKADFDTGISLAKLFEQWRQGARADRRQGGQGHHAPLQAGQVAGAADDIVQVQQQFLHGPTGLLAGAGQADLARAALQQGDAEPLFQLLDLYRQRRGRKVQHGGGAGEVAGLGDRQEGADMLDGVLHSVFPNAWQ